MNPLGPAEDAFQIMRWGATTLFLFGVLTWAWFYVGEDK